MKRVLEQCENDAYKTGNVLLCISQNFKKRALTYLKFGESLTKCLELAEQVEEIKKDCACPVCYDTIKIKVAGACNHELCMGCYRSLEYPKKCPLCRMSFEEDAYLEGSSYSQDTLDQEDEDEEEEVEGAPQQPNVQEAN